MTIKPVIYGGIAARVTRTPAVHAISGLGFVFTSRSLSARVTRSLLAPAYRVAMKHRLARVVFQNRDDMETFARAGLIDRSLSTVILGWGVDLREFPSTPEPPGDPIIALPARMLYDKGIDEFVEAAVLVKARGLRARFVLVGGIDTANPAAIPRKVLAHWVASGAVEWWGHRTDMPSVLSAATIVCLPSYSEGLPRVLIEASASARAIVATDVPGCRELVRDGDTGLLVPPRDAAALANALQLLLNDTALRQALRVRAHAFAHMALRHDIIIDQCLRVYDTLLPASLQFTRTDASSARR